MPIEATLLIQGHGVQEPGLTLAPSDTLAVTFDVTGTPFSFLGILTGDKTVSIASNQGSPVTSGFSGLNQLAETDNHLTKVIITGSQSFYLGRPGFR